MTRRNTIRSTSRQFNGLPATVSFSAKCILFVRKMLQCQCDGLRTTEVRCCALRSDFMNEIVKLFVKASLEWESEVQCLSYLGDAGNYSKYAVLRLLPQNFSIQPRSKNKTVIIDKLVTPAPKHKNGKLLIKFPDVFDRVETPCAGPNSFDVAVHCFLRSIFQSRFNFCFQTNFNEIETFVT